MSEQTALSDLPGGSDSLLEQRGWERAVEPQVRGARWIGWRLRALVLGALLGCLGFFLLLRTLAALPALQAPLSIGDNGAIRVESPAGRSVLVSAIFDPRSRSLPQSPVANPRVDNAPINALALQASARWLTSDDDRRLFALQRAAIAAAASDGTAAFIDTEGAVWRVDVAPRGTGGLGWVFWLYAGAALLLYLVTLVVLLARPGVRHSFFALMTLAQTGHLVLLASASTTLHGALPWFMEWELELHTVFDVLTAAAAVTITAYYPKSVPQPALVTGLAWSVAVLVLLGVLVDAWPQGWLWTQAALLAGAVTTTAQLYWMQRLRAHPLATQLARLSTSALVVLVLLTGIAAMSDMSSEATTSTASMAHVTWVMFMFALMLLLPFLARTQQLVREFSLVAGVSTVATALDLLFVSVFSLGKFASLTLALFAALTAYAAARQWVVGRFSARERVTTERMFENLYRMAREMQARPREISTQFSQVLRDLFDPLHLQFVSQRSRHARVVAEGASLVVPLPQLPSAPKGALVLGFADRGKRLFTEDDAKLADRIGDLLARAVAFDRAVEHGRSEERVRIAQDLHDDIGARLLTLMYKAPNREMEDYVRHTLKDLKTLTRGLAAPSHPLSHAIAEWKADIAQRLATVDCGLSWSFAYGQDFELSVVQWSALTRILRELVNNAIAHAQATHVEVDAVIERGVLSLVVADNGVGSDPQRWSHGLGLGGVRKRVKQLNGEVQWRSAVPRGIECRVTVPQFGPAAVPPATAADPLAPTPGRRKANHASGTTAP